MLHIDKVFIGEIKLVAFEDNRQLPFTVTNQQIQIFKMEKEIPEEVVAPTDCTVEVTDKGNRLSYLWDTEGVIPGQYAAYFKYEDGISTLIKEIPFILQVTGVLR